MRVDLPGREVEAELEGDEDGEFRGEQVAAVHAEAAFDFLEQEENKTWVVRHKEGGGGIWKKKREPALQPTTLC